MVGNRGFQFTIVSSGLITKKECGTEYQPKLLMRACIEPRPVYLSVNMFQFAGYMLWMWLRKCTEFKITEASLSRP